MAATGKCFCGNVKYTLKNGVPKDATKACLCRDCQIVHGTAFSLDTTVPEDQFEINMNIEGQVRTYTSDTDSGKKITRYFCSNCGTHLYSKTESMPVQVVIKAGTLDKLDQAIPNMYIYTDSKPAWFEIPKGVKTAAKMPKD